MKYTLAPGYRVDFIAHAPLHKFKGWVTREVEAQIDIDVLNQRFDVTAFGPVQSFDTGNKQKNRAVMDFMMPGKFPNACVDVNQCTNFKEIGENRYQITVLMILEIMGIRRQMPVTFTAVQEDESFFIEAAFKWSFSAYGLKAPRLLFLKVRDIVDIKASAQLVLAKN